MAIDYDWEKFNQHRLDSARKELEKIPTRNQFKTAAEYEAARNRYHYFVNLVKTLQTKQRTGRFHLP